MVDGRPAVGPLGGTLIRDFFSDRYDHLTEDEAQSEQERLQRKWASVEALVGAEKRLELVAADLVKHYEDRIAALDGKAMIVCMSRRICVALYNAIIKLRPEWHSDDDDAGAIKIVMTGAASDPAAWQPHIGKRPKARRELLAQRAKKPADPLKLVTRADASHRPREPGVPGQTRRTGGRLHRRRPEPQKRPRPIFIRRSRSDRHRRSRAVRVLLE
jgi:hypothetical protein